MNERIKKLYEQSFVTDDYVNVGINGVELGIKFDPEKFAELIVRECTQLLFAESERLYTYSSECDNMHDGDDAELCAEKCMDNIQMIEEHFGVEE